MSASEPIHILLVEDDPEAIRTIWNLLHEKSRFRYVVEAVNRLPDALSRLRKADYDVVLLDLFLATQSLETDAILAIRDVKPDAAVVVITTLEDEGAGLQALEAGAEDYLLREEIGSRALVRALHYAVERTRYEQVLTALEQNYRQLAEVSPQAVLVHQDWVYTYANAAAVHLAGGKDAEQIVGHAPFDFLSSDDETQLREQLSAVLAANKVALGREARWKRLDGVDVEVEIAAAAILWNGAPAVLTQMSDITAHKQAAQRQEKLLQDEQAAHREADRMVGMQRLFLSMISHELRTPLAAIKGFASSLLASDVTFEREESREFLAIIDREADRLTALISQLTDMAQMAAGIFRVEPLVTSVAAVVDSALPQLRTLAARHALDVTVPKNLPNVLADPNRIIQVLVNLVENATKFSPPGTSITLSTSVEKDTIRFNVRDEGEGIDPSERQKVFEAFYQGSPRTVRKPGSGLGLAITKGLVEAHGGTVWIEDRDGRGTTIAFTLKLAQ